MTVRDRLLLMFTAGALAWLTVAYNSGFTMANSIILFILVAVTIWLFVWCSADDRQKKAADKIEKEAQSNARAAEEKHRVAEAQARADEEAHRRVEAEDRDKQERLLATIAARLEAPSMVAGQKVVDRDIADTQRQRVNRGGFEDLDVPPDVNPDKMIG